MNKEIMKLSRIINETLELPPEQIGVIVSALVELLEEIYDYDFNKIIDTIKRCHNKKNLF